jgi:hypothetical protein
MSRADRQLLAEQRGHLSDAFGCDNFPLRTIGPALCLNRLV